MTTHDARRCFDYRLAGAVVGAQYDTLRVRMTFLEPHQPAWIRFLKATDALPVAPYDEQRGFRSAHQVFENENLDWAGISVLMMST